MPVLDYTNANTGIFTHIGKLIKYINSLRTDALAYDAQYQAIKTTFEAGAITKVIAGIDQAKDTVQQQLVSARLQLAAYVDARLEDYDTVVALMALSTNQADSIIERLITQMNIDAQTVDASTVTFGAITNRAGIVGTGLIYLSNVLDGSNQPSPGMSSHPEYVGLLSQLAISETDRFRCTRDRFSGATSGEESFAWSGELPDVTLGIGTEGAGSGVSVNTANAGNLISNKNFETFTTNTPANWTLDAGTAGTHIFSSTSPVFRGTTCLKMTGNGALVAITVSQAPASTLTPRKRYFVAVAIRATNASGALTIGFTGTGYSATAPTPEVQTVQVSGTPTGGTYTLTESIWGQTTAAIAYNAASSAVQSALRLLKGYECVVVATSAGSVPNVTHSVTFHGVQGNVPQLTSTSSLTGGTPVITHATTTTGVAGDQVSLPSTALPLGAWHLAYFWFTAPASVPSDLKLSISWASTPGNTYSMYFDSVAFAAVDYFNGYAAAIVSGATPFLSNDEATVVVSNDGAGTFQEFFRKYYGAQLPSDASAGETILDSLAT